MQRFSSVKLILALALVCLPAGSRHASASPSAVIDQFHGELLNAMRNADALGVRGRYEKLEPVVLATFDVPFMTRLAVGPLWAKSPAEQKQRAWKAFARYITATYATQFDGYSGEEFRVLGEQKLNQGTLVRTELAKPDGEKVTINYVLHDNDAAWQVRDVYLAGTISELATRRSDFTSTLRSDGIEGLIVRLNKKADDLQGR